MSIITKDATLDEILADLVSTLEAGKAAGFEEGVEAVADNSISIGGNKYYIRIAVSENPWDDGDDTIDLAERTIN